jgi:hypothetical protein
MIASEANRAIIRALYNRHADDVADTEVNVPTRGGTGVTSQRMDFLAIASSWARPRVICYEVKVDRRDFVHDTKWQAYLPACHELVFVTKQGVATKGEIPEEAGWQELLTTGALVTRKKAPRHAMAVEVEAVLYKHLLMRKSGKGLIPNREFFEDWLKTKRDTRALGRMVGRELAVTVAQRIAATEAEEGVRETLKALGIADPDTYALRTYDKERDLKRRVHATGVSGVLAEVPQLALDMRQAAALLQATAKRLDTIEEEAKKQTDPTRPCEACGQEPYPGAARECVQPGRCELARRPA